MGSSPRPPGSRVHDGIRLPGHLPNVLPRSTTALLRLRDLVVVGLARPVARSSLWRRMYSPSDGVGVSCPDPVTVHRIAACLSRADELGCRGVAGLAHWPGVAVWAGWGVPG
jgi:hypothetical protein